MGQTQLTVVVRSVWMVVEVTTAVGVSVALSLQTVLLPSRVPLTIVPLTKHAEPQTVSLPSRVLLMIVPFWKQAVPLRGTVLLLMVDGVSRTTTCLAASAGPSKPASAAMCTANRILSDRLGIAWHCRGVPRSYRFML